MKAQESLRKIDLDLGEKHIQKHNIRSCGVSETTQSSLYLEHRVQTVNKGAEMSRRDWQEGGQRGSLGRF